MHVLGPFLHQFSSKKLFISAKIELFCFDKTFAYNMTYLHSDKKRPKFWVICIHFLSKKNWIFFSRGFDSFESSRVETQGCTDRDSVTDWVTEGNWQPSFCCTHVVWEIVLHNSSPSTMSVNKRKLRIMSYFTDINNSETFTAKKMLNDRRVTEWTQEHDFGTSTISLFSLWNLSLLIVSRTNLQK